MRPKTKRAESPRSHLDPNGIPIRIEASLRQLLWHNIKWVIIYKNYLMRPGTWFGRLGPHIVHLWNWINYLLTWHYVFLLDFLGLKSKRNISHLWSNRVYAAIFSICRKIYVLPSLLFQCFFVSWKGWKEWNIRFCKVFNNAALLYHRIICNSICIIFSKQTEFLKI